MNDRKSFEHWCTFPSLYQKWSYWCLLVCSQQPCQPWQQKDFVYASTHFHTTHPQSISCGIRLSSIFEEFMHNPDSFALSSLLIARSHFPGFVRPGVSFIQQNMLMYVYVLRSFCGGHSLYISQVSESRTWLIWHLRTEFLGSVYVFTDPIGLIRPEVSVLTAWGLQLRSQSCTSVIHHHLTSPRATLSTLHLLICFQSLCWSTLVCICLTGATLVC